MSRWIVVAAGLAVAAGVHAALVTVDGRTYQADVVSYGEGVFTLRYDGRTRTVKAAQVERIEFEATEAASDPYKFDICKTSVVVSRIGAGSRDCFEIKPQVRVDGRCYVSTFRRRPVFVLRVNLMEYETRSVAEKMLVYDWKDGRGWRFVTPVAPCDPAADSRAQPDCDWYTLSTATLDNNDSRFFHEQLTFALRQKVLSTRVEVWVDGNLIASASDQKDTSFPLPSGW